MKKKLLIVIILLGFGGYFLFGGFGSDSTGGNKSREVTDFTKVETVHEIPDAETQGGKEAFTMSASLSVLNENQDRVEYGSFTLGEGATALSLLNAAQAGSDFSFSASGSGANAFVTTINGYTPDTNSEYWGFFVNGNASSVGVGSYRLRSGDRIEFRVEKL